MRENTSQSSVTSILYSIFFSNVFLKFYVLIRCFVFLLFYVLFFLVLSCFEELKFSFSVKDISQSVLNPIG